MKRERKTILKKQIEKDEQQALKMNVHDTPVLPPVVKGSLQKHSQQASSSTT